MPNCQWETFTKRYGVPVVIEPEDCRAGCRHEALWREALRTRRLWSVIEDDEGEDWLIGDGNHVVNRLMYLVTPLPLEESVPNSLWSIDGIGTEAPRV